MKKADRKKFPDHGVELPPLVVAQIEALIKRMHWQRAKSVEEIAPHEYNVRGWKKDDVTPREFEALVKLVKAYGRPEEWTSPEGFYDAGVRKFRNSYLYIGDYAYWFTWPPKGVSMMNREHISIQLTAPTRRALPEQINMRV